MTDQEVSDGARRVPRKRNPEESRRRILDAAEGAFSRRGFDGARLRDIAQDAGVHHALVHHYYGDKRGLFGAVLQRGLQGLVELELGEIDVEEGLEAGVTKIAGPLFDFLADNRELLRIIEGSFRDRESVAFEVASEALGAQTQPLLQSIIATLRAGQEAGTVRPDVPADNLLLYCFSLLLYPFIMGSGLASALGLPRYADAKRAAEKSQVLALIIDALSRR